ncbi:MAG: DnaJ domain-containing protein [Armatimonadota bacterium]
MAAVPDHYACLGVPESATLEQIKKRYRELARTAHPDVNPGDDGAARRFADVNDAYRVLSDPDKRRVYDAERSVAARSAARRATPPSGSTARPAQPARPASSATTAPGRPSSPAQVEAERLVEAARNAFRQGRMSEAKLHATRALGYHSRSPAAHEILGDVHRQQGRIDDAFKHYTFCLQFDPRNPRVAERLDRLAREADWRRSRESGGRFPRERRPLAMVLVNYFGYGSAGILSVVAALSKDPIADKLQFGLVDSWTPLHLGLMVASGFLLGATQSVAGTVRRLEDDFLLSGGAGARGATPMGLLMFVLGALQFYVAALLHLATALFQETLHRSLVWTYGTVLAAMCAYAIGNDLATGQTLLWGGNVIFVAHFFGRFLGDFFRQD